MSSQPIGEHALLSDCHSAALVDRTGSIEWLCFPRFDSPSVFGRLLDQRAGFWSIRPRAVTSVSRRYLDQTMVLETSFETAGGTMRLIDALALGPDNGGHGIGRGSPHLLLRRAVTLQGQVEVDMEYVPRPEYGLIHPILIPIDGGVAGQGGAARLRLSTPVPAVVDDSRLTASFTLHSGQAIGFALHHRSSWEELPQQLGGTSEDLDTGGDRRRARCHRSCLALLVRPPSALPGAMARPGSSQRAGPAGAHVSTNGSHHCGSDHVAPGVARRHAQLGLPLHLGTGRLPDHRGALGGGLSRRGG